MTLAVISFLSGSCGRGHRTAAATKVVECDSLPKGVKELVEAVAENDSARFASLVSYPLARPYPLRNIENDKEMMDYYNVMVDDSLKTIIESSGPEKWQKYGWRGWALRDGEYVWLDGDLYDIPYVSHEESVKLDSLRKSELADLHESLHGDWIPMECLISEDGKSVFRIDAGHESKGGIVYRLAVYNDSSDLSGIPTVVMTGEREEEGSALMATYRFFSENGSEVRFVADIADDSTPAIVYISPAGDEIRTLVKRTYWRDLRHPDEKRDLKND